MKVIRGARVTQWKWYGGRVTQWKWYGGPGDSMKVILGPGWLNELLRGEVCAHQNYFNQIKSVLSLLIGQFNTAIIYWSACTKPGKRVVMYFCARDIDVVSYYDEQHGCHRNRFVYLSRINGMTSPTHKE
jgi:hypothetical protein